MKVIIELDDVWKTYHLGGKEVAALQGASLKIFQGEFIAIVGPSGSGKSTMLNSIGALDLPSKGRILLDNNNIAHLSESNLAQIRGKKIGFVFQSFNLIASLNAVDNVALPMVFQELPKEQRIERAKMLLEKVKLSHRIHNLPNQLSGGERQRVAIARALANDPEVILADEPTGNLDSKTGAEILELLQYLQKKEGKTLIMVTHDPSIAKKADRIAHIKDGKVLKIEKR